jgi:hypothetical protein
MQADLAHYWWQTLISFDLSREKVQGHLLVEEKDCPGYNYVF